MLRTLTQQRTTSKLQLALGCVIALSASASWAASPQEIMQVAESQKQSYLETLKTLVNIESGSKDLEGLNQMAKVVADQLKNVGAEVSVIESTDIYRMDDTPEKMGPIVKGVLKGQGKSKIMMIAHMDTVYERGMLKNQPFKIDGNQVYGLGIIDDKQGVAAILHVLNTLKKLNYKDYGTITVLMNSDEEISSPASRKLITETAQDQDVVLSFEGGGKDGNLRLATSGIGAAYLEIKGKSSHAGVKPEAGVNALTELSHQIAQMQNLSDPNTGLKLNWTVAEAGKTRNVIPEHAAAQADVRALRVQDFEAVEKTLNEKIKNKKLSDSQVSVKFEVRRPPLAVNDASKKLAEKAQDIYKNELNIPLTVSLTPTGGGTDAAFAGVKSKAAVIEGMGLSGDGAHSSNAEYILKDSIIPRLYLATRLIVDVSKAR
ncbi:MULTISPECIES: glutamate carboxypeptidase [Acinetobacter]|uniref:glutamate carboxypeptidase n=1 Tax=Acinetobacter TaxID=469 RepID=UPI0015D3D7E8|nr:MULTISPECIES: glutamate carboxypeptidase [Acinetobacter]MCL6230833.1 glutamate carboxypeptidase [Acinetobacter amyesii]MCL6235772.1 glutamate carboxypeptidase [Acinetobacter amyesii]